MYDVQFRRSAIKEIKKLDKPVRKEMLKQINTCGEEPHTGKSLKGDLSSYYSHAFSYKGVDYRIIYTLNHTEKIITIELAGSRENIYAYLKRMF